VIRTFGLDRFGQPLFVPIAGKTDPLTLPSPLRGDGR
jgi:hypothetical protein